MKSLLLNNLKRSNAVMSLLQVICIIYWLTSLRNTDSYYVPYVIVGVCGVFLIYNNVNEKRMISVCSKESLVIFLFSSFFSIVSMAANYKILSEVEILENAGSCFKFLYQNGSYIVMFGGGFFAFCNVLYYLVSKLKNFYFRRAKNKWLPQYVYFVSMLLIAGFNSLVMFTCFYPGNITSDSVSIMQQALNGSYSNHHPYYYTKTVEFFLMRGMEWFHHDINASAALFHVFQIIFMAACISYIIVTLYQMEISFILILSCWLWYIIMPYHIMFSFTMWKDVMFGGFVSVFIVSVFRIWKKIGKNSFINDSMLIVGGIGTCLYRSNGWMACFLAFLVFLFLFGEEQEKRKMSLQFLGVILISFLLNYPLLQAINVSQPSIVEALSVPVQQMAKIVKECDDISEENIELLRKVVDIDHISEIYRPENSGPVINLIKEGNWQYFLEHKAIYIKLYIEMSLSHFTESTEAWIDLTKGYWNGGYSRWKWADWIEGGEELGIQRTVSVKTARRLLDNYLWIYDNNSFFQIFCSIGFHVWIIICLAFLSIIRKDKESFFLTIPIIANVITLLMTAPVYSEFRYLYALFCCIPFIIFGMFYERYI